MKGIVHRLDRGEQPVEIVTREMVVETDHVGGHHDHRDRGEQQPAGHDVWWR
jgi:hypothetical protein